MTSVQIYALFINPLLMLAWVAAFAAVLIKRNKRNAKRIAGMEAARKSADATASSPLTRNPTPEREEFFAK